MCSIVEMHLTTELNKITITKNKKNNNKIIRYSVTFQ